MGEADAVLEFPIGGTTLMTFSPCDAFAHYAERGPESHMELVSNRLLLGGDIRGSLAMLGYILS